MQMHACTTYNGNYIVLYVYHFPWVDQVHRHLWSARYIHRSGLWPMGAYIRQTTRVHGNILCLATSFLRLKEVINPLHQKYWLTCVMAPIFLIIHSLCLQVCHYKYVYITMIWRYVTLLVLVGQSTN